MKDIVNLFSASIVRDDNTVGSERFLSFRITELGGGKRGGNGHDTRGNQSLGVDTHGNIGNEDGTSNGSKTRSHDLVDLSFGQVRNKGLNQDGRLTLANERRGGGDDSFGTRDLHGPEEKASKLSDGPLDPTPVVKDVDKGNEEDDGRKDGEEKVGQGGNLGVKNKARTSVGKTEELTGEERDKVEDIVTGASTENKQGDDELDEHARDDSVPFDSLSVVGGGPKDKEGNNTAKEGNSTVRTLRIGVLRRSKGTDENDTEGTDGSSEVSVAIGDEVDDSDHGSLPDPVAPFDEVSGRNMEGDETGRDHHPEDGGNEPLVTVFLLDHDGDPPGSEEEAPEEVNDPAVLSVDGLDGFVVVWVFRGLYGAGVLAVGYAVAALELGNVHGDAALGVIHGGGGARSGVEIGMDLGLFVGKGRVMGVVVEVLVVRV